MRAAAIEEIERLARARGLTRLDVASSLNAEPFYARLGYQARHRQDIVLRNGHRLAAVLMDKSLECVVFRSRETQ